MSLPSAIFGPGPLDQVAVKAVGMPAAPRTTVKPFFSRMPVRYSLVLCSWKPGSAKLNTMSTISCASLVCASTSSAATFFWAGVASASAGLAITLAASNAAIILAVFIVKAPLLA